MDEEAIRQVAHRYVETWNSHDMTAWGKLFTDDVDYVNRNGGWWKSNEKNVKGHQAIHEMLARHHQEMNFRLTVERISFLKPDLALVHAVSEWPGATSASGPGKGINTIMTMIMVKQEGAWLIRALHNTVASPPSP